MTQGRPGSPYIFVIWSTYWGGVCIHVYYRIRVMNALVLLNETMHEQAYI
jgi:hypothetical protein